MRVLALDALRRRAAHLPGLLDELRPVLPRALGTHHDAVQGAALALLADLLPSPALTDTSARAPNKTLRETLKIKDP